MMQVSGTAPRSLLAFVIAVSMAATGSSCLNWGVEEPEFSGDGDSDVDTDADTDVDGDADDDRDEDVAPTLCDDADDCDDSVECTHDTCAVGGVCRHIPLDDLCLDGEHCRVGVGCVPEGADGDADVDADVDGDVDGDVDSDADGDFDPLLHYDGCFFIAPTVSQRCAFGAVNYSFDRVCFETLGPALTLNAGGYELSQSPRPDGTGFDVEFAIPSGCTETYRLTGTFSDAGHFSGTWTSTFIGECTGSGCSPLTISVEGTRAPCSARCEGRECGSDACGGLCSPGCGTGETCGLDGLCVTEPSSFDPAVHYSGSFRVFPVLSSDCHAAVYTLRTLNFSSSSSELEVAAESFITLSQEPRPGGGSFDVNATQSGCGTYRITGRFSDSDNFTGTWSSSHSGGCGVCANHDTAITGIRSP